jgi:hypothetical protein
LQHLDLLTVRNLPVFFEVKYESYTFNAKCIEKVQGQSNLL